jgi:hypothetical protein
MWNTAALVKEEPILGVKQGLVSLSPGFKAAVNVEADLDDGVKVGGYIPTKQSRSVFDDFAEQLHPSSAMRSRLLMGTYGTGKSHLAAVLARLYRDGAKDAAVTSVLHKLEKWPETAKAVSSRRNKIDGKFLLVLAFGDPGPFNDVLLRGLENSLLEAGLGDLLPETAFDAAKRRIESLHDDDVLWDRFLKAVSRSDYPSVEALQEGLSGRSRDAFDAFCTAHETVLAGARFNHFEFLKPHEVYRAVGRALVDEKTGYCGISVIWDEFGHYMENVVEDPRGDNGLAIQEFTEKAANVAGSYPIHLYLICHRSLREYLALSVLNRVGKLSQVDQDEWTRITGRFSQFVLTTTDHEVFELIDNVIVQHTETEEWISFLASAHDEIEYVVGEANRLRLFPDFRKDEIRDVVVEGAYPLHPMAAYLLPRVSQRVAQNNRTLFQFLSDSDGPTLGGFLRTNDVSSEYSPFHADGLWNYFERVVADQHQFRDLSKKFQHADGLVSPDDELSKRTLRAIALLNIVGADRTPATADVIAFALGMGEGEVDGLEERLDAMCSRSGNTEPVLAKSSHKGTYRFPSIASDLAERVVNIARERMELVQLGAHLRNYSSFWRIPGRVQATAYSDDVGTDRNLRVWIAEAADLSDAEKWHANLGKGSFDDGEAILVLCETRDELDHARKAAETNLKHPQILLAIPKQPRHFRDVAARHEALAFLASEQKELYGLSAPLRAEWQEHFDDYTDSLNGMLLALWRPEERAVDWYRNGVAIPDITAVSRLTALASDMMHDIFSLTPRLAPAKLTSEEGNDTYGKIRRPIIDKLIRRDGPDQLFKETAKEQNSVIEAFYKRTGILVRSGRDAFIRRPDEVKHRQAAAVWDAIDGFLDEAKTAGHLPIRQLQETLRRPPYGLRPRSLSLLFAAVARDSLVRSNLSFDYRGLAAAPTPDGKLIDEALMGSGYELVHTDIGRKQEAVLKGVASAYGIEVADEAAAGQLMESICDRAQAWWHEQPLHAQVTSQLPPDALWIRDNVLAELGSAACDPRALLLDKLASEVPSEEQQAARGVARRVSDAMAFIQSAVGRLSSQVLTSFADALSSESDPPEHALTDWARKLPPGIFKTTQGTDGGHLLRAAEHSLEAAPGVETYVALAETIVGLPLENWDDRTLDRIVGRIEGAKDYLEAWTPPPALEPRDGEVVIPQPPAQQVSLVLIESEQVFQRNLSPAKELSANAERILKLMRNNLQGVKGSLAAGEMERLLLELLREFA